MRQGRTADIIMKKLSKRKDLQEGSVHLHIKGRKANLVIDKRED
jgi:hypothetical protein